LRELKEEKKKRKILWYRVKSYQVK